MLINSKQESKEPVYDKKAGQQIFDKEHRRDNTPQVIHIPKDTENPIDIKLRQLSLGGSDQVSLKAEFIGRWAVVIVGEIKNLRYAKGRIVNLYSTRDIHIKTRKGEDIIVPFGRCQLLSDKEPA